MVKKQTLPIGYLSSRHTWLIFTMALTDRGTSKQSLIQENIMLQKMAGVWKDHPLALFIPHPRIQIGINQVDEEIE